MSLIEEESRTGILLANQFLNACVLDAVEQRKRNGTLCKQVGQLAVLKHLREANMSSLVNEETQ